MNLLVIDTSTDRAVVALAEGDRHRVASEEPGTTRHGRHLLPTIAGLVEASGLRPRDLDAIAVGLGPGSYTGLRVGLTAAKTLAFALGKPLVPLDSFEAIAPNAPADAGCASIYVIGDAQRGDLFVARFARPAPELTPQGVEAIRIVEKSAWAASLEPGSWVLGSTLDRLRITWPEGVHLGTVDQGYPSPDALIALGATAVRSGNFASTHAIEPAYLRRSAAEDQWDRRP